MTLVKITKTPRPKTPKRRGRNAILGGLVALLLLIGIGATSHHTGAPLPSASPTTQTTAQSTDDPAFSSGYDECQLAKANGTNLDDAVRNVRRESTRDARDRRDMGCEAAFAH